MVRELARAVEARREFRNCKARAEGREAAEGAQLVAALFRAEPEKRNVALR